MLNAIKSWWIIGISFLVLTSCQQRNINIPAAIKGEFDASRWDFDRSSTLTLDGEWKFQEQTIQVPGTWPDSVQYGEYLLRVKLPEKNSGLGLRLAGISTSYELWINDKLVGQVGSVSKNRAGVKPEYENRIYPLPDNQSELLLIIKVANIDHYKGGILQSLVLGNFNTLSNQLSSDSLLGGILIGICVVSTVVYLTLFLFMRDKKYFLFYAIYVFIIAIHMLCLADRTLYHWVGWTVAYKIELATIVIGLCGKFLFYDSFFKNILDRKQLIVMLAVLLGQALLIFLLPAPWFTLADLLVPVNFVLATALMAFMFSKAIRNNLEGSSTIAGFNIFLLVVFANESFILQKHITGLLFLHIAVIFYVAGISIVLIRKIIQVFYSEKELSHDLSAAMEKLEKQNKSLEEIVTNRTAQLVEAEKQSHQLQLDKKARDMDMLAASNLMKLQFSRNLIEELEALPKQEKELKPALNSLISKLKNQASIEEKLEVLQNDLNRINAEFYERLGARFPDLSKTERELCAYIKLNLSNKDIAELRKTSINTINVARSRLRKKLGLGKDDELESFIMQF